MGLDPACGVVYWVLKWRWMAEPVAEEVAFHVGTIAEGLLLGCAPGVSLSAEARLAGHSPVVKPLPEGGGAASCEGRRYISFCGFGDGA